MGLFLLVTIFAGSALADLHDRAGKALLLKKQKSIFKLNFNII
jgi:hypothetical protein